MQELIANGKVAYAYVGITTEDLTPSLARHLGYSIRHGALIDTVLAGTPGARAGLQGGTRQEEFIGTTVSPGGDVILAIDRRPVASAEDVIRIVAEELRPGQIARFTVLRHGKRLEVPVMLATRPSNPRGR
jgi:S1-C subfamily serine protease